MAPYARGGGINQGVQNKIHTLAIIFRRCLELPAVCHLYFLSWISDFSRCALFSSFLDSTSEVAAFIERKCSKTCLTNPHKWIFPGMLLFHRLVFYTSINQQGCFSKLYQVYAKYYWSSICIHLLTKSQLLTQQSTSNRLMIALISTHK